MPETKTPPASRRTHRLRIVAVAAGLTGLACAVWYLSRDAALPVGISQDEYSDAERRFQEKYGRQPGRLDVLSLLGELAVRESRLTTAAACFREIPTDDPKYGLPARLQEGHVLARLKRAGEAERSLREFLAHASNTWVHRNDVVAAYKWLGYLLSVELRFEERKALLAEMHARGLADVHDSTQYYFPHLLIWHSSSGREPLAEFLKQDPQNPLLRVALARYRTFEGRLDEARALLQDLHRENPDDLYCAAALLECHFERNDWDAFAGVIRKLPERGEGEPWLLTRMRGEFALDEGRWEDAARYFKRVQSVDPANPWAQMGLAEAYAKLERPEARQEALRRSLVLARIRSKLGNVTERDPAGSLELAAACDEIGLREAAEVFRRHAARINAAAGRTRQSAGTPPQETAGLE